MSSNPESKIDYLKQIEQIFADDEKENNLRSRHRRIHANMGFESDVIYDLVRARIEKNMTQREFADILGVKQSSLARLEAGKSNPTLLNLAKIARALGKKLVLRDAGDTI